MNFLKIAHRDVESILKNRFIRVSVIAIIIVPLLYSLLYLAAFWDPYSKLQLMPVAVVNLDEGATQDGKEVNYGKDLVDNLKNNSKLGWKFVSLDDAQKGVKGSKYYGMFVIPKEFSEDAISAKEGVPKKASILFTENDKRNFLASQINSKVVIELKQEITKNISDEYTKVTFDSLYDLKDGMNEAADGSKELKDGAVTLKDGSKELKDGIKALNDKVPEMTNGVAQLFNGSLQLNNGLIQAKNGVISLYGGANQLNFGLGNAKTGASQISNGLGQINSQVPTLVNGVSDLYKGSSDLKNGINQAKQGSSQLNSGLSQINGQVPTLTSGVSDLYKGSGELEKGIDQAKSGSGQLNQGLKQMDGQVPTLVSGVSDLYKGSGDLQNGITNAKSGADQVNNGMNQLIDTGITPAAQGTNDLDTALNSQLLPSMQQISDGSAQVYQGVNQLIGNMSNTQTALNDAANNYLKVYLAKHPEAMQDENMKNFLSALTQIQAQTNDPANQKKIAAIQEGAKDLSTGSAQLYSGMNGNFKTGLDTLNQSMPKISQGAKTIAGYTDSLAKGLGNILTGANKLNGGLNQLNQNVPAMADGINQLYDGSTSLDGGLAKLSTGAKNLNGGLNNLNTNMPALGKGIGQLASGSKSLDDGLATLSTGAGKLNGGLNDLNNKVPELASGVSQLSGGSTTLLDGLNKLFSGSAQLRDSIAKPNEIKTFASNDSLKAGLLTASRSNFNSVLSRSNIANVNNENIAGVTASSGTTLYDGIAQLNDGSLQLKDGLGTLKSKLPQLQDGAVKLEDGTNQLYDGIVKIADGSSELNTKLKDGADKLTKNLKNDSKTMGEFVSEPLTVNEKPINPVKNYGTGFTPYFIPLSLWVGALMMFFIITDKVDDDIKAGPRSLVAGKFLSYGYIGFAQAILVSVVVLFLGLKPNNLPLYFVTNIIMSFVFIAIMQSLIFLLGQAGRLLSIALLILQLTSSAGTFPLEVLPKFFKVINPVAPFTYCTQALREVISGVDYSVYSKDITVLICIMIVFLSISMVMKGHADKVQKRIRARMEAMGVSI